MNYQNLHSPDTIKRPTVLLLYFLKFMYFLKKLFNSNYRSQPLFHFLLSYLCDDAWRSPVPGEDFVPGISSPRFCPKSLSHCLTYIIYHYQFNHLKTFREKHNRHLNFELKTRIMENEHYLRSYVLDSYYCMAKYKCLEILFCCYSKQGKLLCVVPRFLCALLCQV